MDDIFEWKYSPVVLKAYREYRIYAGMPILRSKEPGEMDNETTNFLIEFADDHRDFIARGLVNLTYREGYPWKRVYREGEKYTKIPFDTIISIEYRA